MRLNEINYNQRWLSHVSEVFNSLVIKLYIRICSFVNGTPFIDLPMAFFFAVNDI